MKGKVLVTGSSVDDRFFNPLRAEGLDVHNPTHLLPEGELRAELADAVAYLVGGDEFASATAMADATRLKVIAFLGVGYESFIDVRAATARGIRVTNTPGTLTNSVAEFTVGQLLNARRRLTQYTNAFMRGQHGTETKQRDLAGTTVGIIGLGAIGSRIAQILRAGFNCPVIYFSRTRKADLEQQLGIKYAPLDDLAGAADALVVMTPGNETTTNLVGQTVFSTMKAGSLVVNTARPAIVNPQGLLAALKANVVAIAAFDGFYPPECPERAELLALGDERLLVTGHIGSLTAEARDGMALKAVQSIVNVLQHGADAYVINSE